MSALPAEVLAELDVRYSLTPEAVEGLKAAEQLAEAEADAKLAHKREVQIKLNEVVPAYEAAQRHAAEAYVAWCEAAKASAELRGQYESVWASAKALDLPVPVRIAPSARPPVAAPTRW